MRPEPYPLEIVLIIVIGLVFSIAWYAIYAN